MTGANVADRDTIVGDYWSGRKRPSGNWWGNRATIRSINMRVAGDSSTTTGGGFLALTNQFVGGQPLRLGISVGCGRGYKELQLIERNVVQKMICYDLSEERIADANQMAAERGLTDRIEFVVADAFVERTLPEFDVVHWNNALHHMFDVPAAVAWSHQVLKPGGVFMLDDYVGPNRMRISKDALEFANSIRGILPERMFERPPRAPLPRRVTLEWLEKNIEKDPSETVDAERTLPAILEHFPEAVIKPTGGIAYFIAFNGIYSNLDLDRADDKALLNHVLLLDRIYTEAHPESTLYAVAVARKAGGPS